MKKHLKFIAFVVVGIIIIPACIHIAFKTPAICDFFVPTWSSGDVLSFYGIIIGAIVAVVGVKKTIDFSTSNYEEDAKFRILPFMSLTILSVKSSYNVFDLFFNNETQKEQSSNDEFGDELYKEFTLDTVYFIISGEEVYLKSELTDKQKELIKNCGHYVINEDGTKKLMSENCVYMPMELENCGSGLADMFRIGLNKSNVPEKERLYTRPIPMKIGQKNAHRNIL